MAPTDRRTFMVQCLGAGAVLGLPTPLRAADPEAAPRFRTLPPTPRVADEAYWELVKRSFPLAPGLILMNAANLCPSPFAVQDAVFSWTRDIDADPSFQNRGKFRELRESSRAAVAGLLGCDADEIALTRNTSEGNNTVVAGLDLGPGDEVVLWDQNHPTNSTSWDVRAEREGFSVRRVSTPDVPGGPGVLMDSFMEALGARTRVLAFSHVSNGSGVRLPAAELCAEARRRGILTLLDGAQSCGALRIDLRAIGCDFYTASTHKWLTGPKEAGILYVSADVIERLSAADVGVGWERALEGGARKFETLGQRDDACVAAVAVAVALHQRIGPETIEARLLELTGALHEGLRARVPGVHSHTPTEASVSSGVVVFRIPGVPGGEAFQRLYEEHQIAATGRGGTFDGVRLSPHLYNTLEEMERAVAALAEIARG